mmetsp:Transcript_7551/g.17117  ORF Transcript_7551/g.17117 Transcript_7551/m.17117 type:complete len:1310 (+) Transcript_7551:61-3990(+)
MQATMGGTVITCTFQTLLDSGCLSRHVFLFDQEAYHDSTGILGHSHHDGSDDGKNNSPLQIQNAVKLSLALARTFVQCLNGTKNNYALTSLRLDDFVVKMRGKDGYTEEEGDEHLLSISSVDQFNAISSNSCIQWIIMDVKCCCAQTSSVNMNTATLMQHLGKLIYAIFSQNDASASETHFSNGDGARASKICAAAHKARRRMSKSLFEHLIESGKPISVCRFLNDLTGKGKTSHPIISFDDVIRDLEQMNSQPHIFLFNPEDTFYTLNLNFGQGYYGRSKELAKLLEITTVPNEINVGLEIIFISGIAGSGKSHLISAVGRFISNLGYMVLTAKFERGMEYNSREIVSALFDRMVTSLVEMKESDNKSDIDYSRRVTQAISNALDAYSLSSLADFVPSIQRLIPPKVARDSLSCSSWQLVFSLSKLLFSVLSQERKIFIALDDLQWADPTMLGLMSEVLTTICQHPEERRRLVFVGMYRDDEVTSDLLQFTTRFENQEGNISANVTNTKLSTFSQDDVVEMAMSEFRLPRRLVSELAGVVHKKAHGHPLFVVQLLNSLVLDSTIAYTPSVYRYDWDQDKICILQTPDSVASLIVSNLASLPAESLQYLRIISCFGIQVQFSLLELLNDFRQAPRGGFESYQCGLVDQGIIENVGPLVAFAHDLIQEQVYEGIPVKERRQLHLDIGIYLGSKTSLDTSSQNKPIDAAIEQLYLSDVSDTEDTESSLVSIATSQINNAGPECFTDRRSPRFARWNLRAGKDAAELSSFRTALHYYKNGIAFLGEALWLDATYDLCLKLHDNAAFSSSSLGEINQVSMYANAIIANVTSFQDSLVAQRLLIGSLSASGQYQEAVARGLAALRQLKFDIPATPSAMAVIQSMKQTEIEASEYKFSKMADYQRVDSKTKNIMKLVEAISSSCYHIASPFLPLIACESVRFSLRNGFCDESATAVVVFAYFQLFLKQSFDQAHHWGSIAKSMLERASTDGLVVKARMKLFSFVWFWHIPWQESINHLQDTYDLSLKVGETECAYMTMCVKLKFSFFRGEQLSSLSRSFDKYLQEMARFSIGSAIFSALDKEMVDELVGDKSSNPYSVFKGEVCDKESILADAESKAHFQMVEAVHLQNFFVLFWKGDYVEAERASAIAMSFPSSKMPKGQLVFHTFYRGIIAFNLYRDGRGEKWLNDGKEMLVQMEIWAINSKPIVENKLILMEAEHYASMCNVVAAKESYKLAIKVARDYGFIHEQGLACECFGQYLSSIVEVGEAERYFMDAYTCYIQWGAVAKANTLREDHGLDLSTGGIRICTSKHERDE